MRSAFRRRGPNGVLRFYAAAAQLQATIAGLCGRQAQELNDVNISTAAASLFRYVVTFLHTVSLSLFILLAALPIPPFPFVATRPHHHAKTN